MVLMMGIIFFLSSKTGDSFQVPSFPGIDKIAHASIYGVLAATVIFAQSKKSRERKPLLVILITVIACLLYGISDEFHQSMVPGRFPSGLDIVADVCGATVVCVGWIWWRSRGQKLKARGQSADSA